MLFNRSSQVKKISSLADFKGSCIVDVREESEWNQGHYDNAILLPLSHIVQGDFGSLKKDESILLYCRSGHRSVQAGKILIKNGFQDIVSLEGGYKPMN